MTKKDLENLLNNSVIENRTLEYKKDIKVDRDSEKREFLADISSFANSIGGKIIFGISEDRMTGKPKELCGLDIENFDQFILKLENLISSGIEPRIVGVEFEKVEISGNRFILIANVPKSWLNPHRVIFNGHGHFYIRTTSGKHRLDVAELRVAFNLSDSAANKIKNFRQERIGNILTGEAPLELFENKSYSLLHMLPFDSLIPGTFYDINPKHYERYLKPIDTTTWDSNYNFDGYIAFAKNNLGKCYAYTQLFRNGIIEALETIYFNDEDEKRFLYPDSFEPEILKSIHNYFKVQEMIGAQLPIFIFLTFIGCKGFTIYPGRKLFGNETIKFHKDILYFPEVIVENYNIKPHEFFRPILDSIWNSCGYENCPNFDDENNYLFRR